MNKLFPAYVILEDGKILQGYSNTKIDSIGEIVFTTSMTGYQKALTDPSYRDQILVMTYPLQGNYGTNINQKESDEVQVKGFIIKELIDQPSHWQSKKTLKTYLNDSKIPYLFDVDTRALTKHLRNKGSMMGSITTNTDHASVIAKINNSPKYGSKNVVEQVSTKKIIYPHKNTSNKIQKITILDLGVKNNIKRILEKNNSQVTIVPHTISFEEINKLNPQGIIISPGPGDPMQLIALAPLVRKLAEKYPLLGICLGHQLLGISFSAKSYKLPYGNRGSNHPIIDMKSKKIFITSQNHGYAIDPDKMNPDMRVSQINLNDGHVEALVHKYLPVSSIQYHPEASPGPKDTEYIFNNFLDSLKNNKGK